MRTRRTKYDRSPAPLGTVRVRYSSGNKGNKPQRFIKVAMAGRKQDRWMAYSRWLWEQDNGPVPKGFLVAHRDGDLMNDDPTNLILATPGDVVYLAHANDPKMSEENFRKLRKATAAHNRERGRVNRALNWLPASYYAFYPAVGQVWNEPRRRANIVLSRCGVSGHWRRQWAEALGWGGHTLGEALVLHVLSASDGPISISAITDAVNRLADVFDWRPRTNAFTYQSLRRIVQIGIVDRSSRGRYELTEMAVLERTRRSPVFAVRGETLASHPAFQDVEKVARLKGICHLCGCTEHNACWDDLLGPCSWVSPDLCSHCEVADDCPH